MFYPSQSVVQKFNDSATKISSKFSTLRTSGFVFPKTSGLLREFYAGSCCILCISIASELILSPEINDVSTS